MTADQWRAAEEILDIAALHGVKTLAGARRLISATIVGLEIHESEPSRSLDSVEVECAVFLLEGEMNR